MLPRDATGIIFVDSGAGAIFAALRAHGARLGGPAGAASRAILPAYCCPRVLGAVLGAGWEPCFVDLAPNSIEMERPKLLSALDSGSAAVLIVDLFGLDGLSDRRVLSRLPRPVLILRDFAQCFMSSIAGESISGALGILSFGRGKPVSVLGGGAVVIGAGTDLESLVRSELRSCRRLSPVFLGIRAGAYDAALNPLVYHIVRRIPGLGIGRTRLTVTSSATELQPDFGDFVANQHEYVLRTAARRTEQVKRTIDSASRIGLRPLAGVGEPLASSRLSRVPFVAPSEAYAERACRMAGHLGVTRMYGRTLPEFIGVNRARANEKWPNAFSLSRRLLTLPATGRLASADFDQLIIILTRAHGSD